MTFYKFTESDLPVCFGMNDSELKLYLWLNVHLPFADSKAIEIDTAKLAKEIGISRRSVQRALKSIEARKIFDFEIVKAKVKRMATQMSPNQESSATSVSSSPENLATFMSEQRHPCRRNDTHVAETTQMSPTQPETFTQQSTDFSQTLQTLYKDLSDRREEIFENEKNDKNEKNAELKQFPDRKTSTQQQYDQSDRSGDPPQTAQNSLEIAKTNKDFMDWAVRRSVRLNARNAQIHATTCLKRDEAFILWQEYQRSLIKPQPLYLNFDSMDDYYRYLEKRREELLYGAAS